MVLYYIVPRKIKNFVLFISSLVFYAWGEPVYILLMLFSTVFNYAVGLGLDKTQKNDNKKNAKLLVALAVVVNLAILGYFKYADFLIGNVNAVFKTKISMTKLALPIGISFYTFQTMSYVIDVYRGDSKVQKNIIAFGTYVALFPQLIAGPIVRYNTIASQLDSRKESFQDFSYGVQRFVTGLGKKVLIANNIGALYDLIVAGSLGETPALTAWLGAFAYTFQIYFDFSGYSDMAIGLGSMFGFKFLENFDYPYESRSITEFWRRWHISLGTWFREYVYIPLGGNRCSLAKQIRNLAVVWVLTGVWHGAAWNFILWGTYFGVLLCLEKFIYGKKLKSLPSICQRIYTIFLVVLSWVVFAANDLGAAVKYIGAMFGMYKNGFADTETLYLINSFGLLLIIAVFACTHLPSKIAGKIMARLEGNEITYTIVKNVFLIAVLILVIAYLVNATYNPFLYFRF